MDAMPRHVSKPMIGLSDENGSVAWPEESVNRGQKCRVTGGAHVGGHQLAADEEAVDAVVKPVLCERVVEFGVARGKWKADDEKEAQREPGQESSGEVYPSNRQAKYAECETFRVTQPWSPLARTPRARLSLFIRPDTPFLQV